MNLILLAISEALEEHRDTLKGFKASYVYGDEEDDTEDQVVSLIIETDDDEWYEITVPWFNTNVVTIANRDNYPGTREIPINQPDLIDQIVNILHTHPIS